MIPEKLRSKPKFKPPVAFPTLPSFNTVDAGNITGYAEITAIQRDPLTKDAYGVASNSNSHRYPWGLERFEEKIEHRTSDINPAHTSVTGKYALIEELDNRTIRMEQDVVFKSDENNFHMSFIRRLRLNGKVMHEKHWNEIFPRDFQ